MKISSTKIGSSLVLSLILATAHLGLAQSSTTTSTTTTSSGTIGDFSPNIITVKTESAPEPVRYTYTKTTTYVDESGSPVSMDLVKSGLPVTVYYVKDGDQMVISKVVVKKAVEVAPAVPAVVDQKTTTTTTTVK